MAIFQRSSPFFSLNKPTNRILRFPSQLENIVQENVRSGMEEMKRSAVHTQTAAMLEMGTNLLSQSAEQTRKLTDVETQVSQAVNVPIKCKSDVTLASRRSSCVGAKESRRVRRSSTQMCLQSRRLLRVSLSLSLSV